MLLLCYYWCKFLCTGSQKAYNVDLHTTATEVAETSRRCRYTRLFLRDGWFPHFISLFPRNRRFEEAAFHPTCIGKNQWVQNFFFFFKWTLTCTPTTWYHNWVLQNLGYYILLLLHIDGKGHHYILNGDCLFIFCVKKCSCDCNMYICCYKCSFMFVECVYIRALACGKGIVK